MKLADIRKCALDLPDSDRAALAAELLDSLPAVLSDEDDGVAEALRRSRTQSVTVKIRPSAHP